MKYAFIFLFCFLYFLYAETINIPFDYPTIQQGLDAASNGDTVLVEPGTYVENIFFPPGDVTLVSVSGPEQTIIDASEYEPPYPLYGSAIAFLYSGCGVVDGFTMMNGVGTDQTGVGLSCGGGIFIRRGSPTIINNIIKDNHAGWGGGIMLMTSAPQAVIANNVIKNNCGVYSGSGIMFYKDPRGSIIGNLIQANEGATAISIFEHNYGLVSVSNNVIADHESRGFYVYSLSPSSVQDLVNNTFVNNGSGVCYWQTSGTITNCIFWDTSPGYYEIKAGENSYINFEYSDIYGGESSIRFDSTSTVNIGAGIIDDYPDFIPGPYCDYHLSELSPCVDAGNPDPFYNDPEDPANPGYALWPALGTVICDMGAFGGPGALVWTGQLPVGVEHSTAEAKNILLSNYPNPFTTFTTVRIELAVSENAILTVYDISGRKVDVIAEGYYSAGEHLIQFDAENLCIGIYFVRLETESTVDIHSCMLLR